MDVLQLFQSALEAPQQALALLGLAVALAGLLYLLIDAISYRRIPALNVPLTQGQENTVDAGQRISAAWRSTDSGADMVLSCSSAEEAAEQLQGAELYTPTTQLPKDKIPCYDPSSMKFLGNAKAMSPAEVCCCLHAVQLASPCLTPAALQQHLCNPSMFTSHVDTRLVLFKIIVAIFFTMTMFLAAFAAGIHVQVCNLLLSSNIMAPAQHCCIICTRDYGGCH
jgi:hypothetical protein